MITGIEQNINKKIVVICISDQLHSVCIVARHGRSGAKSNGINSTGREEDEIVRGIFRKSDGVRVDII